MVGGVVEGLVVRVAVVAVAAVGCGVAVGCGASVDEVPGSAAVAAGPEHSGPVGSSSVGSGSVGSADLGIDASGSIGSNEPGAADSGAVVPAGTVLPLPPGSTAQNVVGVLAGADWTVVEVTDGDTIVVTGLDGDRRVRLIGINTPESDECFGDEATAGMRALVEGRAVRLVSDRSDTDRYGRLLRFVEVLDDDGTELDVGAELVGAGFALSRRYPPDVARNDRYDALQSEARAAGRGLWAPDACGDPTLFGVGEVRLGIEIQADAPGDDGQNLNGEWVRFINESSEDLDLESWEIADESASHRYRFGALVLRPGGAVTLFSGCGIDTTTERYWCNQGSAVWNNSGDTVFVKDPSGNIVIAESYRN